MVLPSYICIFIVGNILSKFFCMRLVSSLKCVNMIVLSLMLCVLNRLMSVLILVDVLLAQYLICVAICFMYVFLVSWLYSLLLSTFRMSASYTILGCMVDCLSRSSSSSTCMM